MVCYHRRPKCIKPAIILSTEDSRLIHALAICVTIHTDYNNITLLELLVVQNYSVVFCSLKKRSEAQRPIRDILVRHPARRTREGSAAATPL